jgi:flavin-dependent thymidylate synthase
LRSRGRSAIFIAVKVLLAGFNLDKEVIDDLKRHSPPRDDVTPETLSASYARISRDPRPVDELRAAARAEVERARRSNQSIIFRMGHHSVAEHAVFNFDILGVSRLAIEEIERFRLGSYTEKSQRYITLGDDFVIPEEVREAGLEALFTGTVRAQNALYHKLYARLKPHVFNRFKKVAENPKNHSVLDGWAKEDARYVVSLATCGQLGMTLNARNLELLIRRFASKGLAELREFNRLIQRLAKEAAPSIILFTEAGAFDAKALGDVRDEFARSGAVTPRPINRRAGKDRDIALVDWTRDADDKVLAALGHATSGESYDTCRARAETMTGGRKKSVFKAALGRMEFYDFPLREFEYADLTFELVVSASCFAQLKRHRMATLTSQSYDPGLGVSVPPSVREIGARSEFMEIIERTDETHHALKKAIGPAADYVLTNAHRRRVLLKVNARELYHISRLREDATAQWDIRDIAARMSALAKKVMPLTCLLLGGKDFYPEIYRRVFGRPPGMTPAAMIK